MKKEVLLILSQLWNGNFMITASQLTELTTLTAGALTKLVRATGRTKENFVSCLFLGLTNAGEFCYSAKYLDGTTEVSIKVFITRNTAGQLTATIWQLIDFGI